MKSLATTDLQSLRTPHYHCLSAPPYPAPPLPFNPSAPRTTTDFQRLKIQFRACDTHSAAIPYKLTRQPFSYLMQML